MVHYSAVDRVRKVLHFRRSNYLHLTVRNVNPEASTYPREHRKALINSDLSYVITANDARINVDQYTLIVLIFIDVLKLERAV